MSIQFKRRAPSNSASNGKVMRPRIEEEVEEEEEQVTINRPELRLPGNKALQATTSTSHRKIDDEDGAVTKVYISSREVVPQSYAGDATHTSEIDTDITRDARAILERNIQLNETGILDREPNIYRGQTAYKNFVKKDAAQIGANKFTGTQGPIRAPAFVRSTARFDYQPDICKDYKETGFCGYGDQCKFLHDRGDYKSGWQLEKEWDAEQSRKKKRLEDSLVAFTASEEGTGPVAEEVEEEDYSVELDESLPFACHICRGDFNNPVVTLCGHYFCQDCALQQTKEDSRCPVCKKQTSGVFNKAHRLIKQLSLRGGVSDASAASGKMASSGAWEAVDD